MESQSPFPPFVPKLSSSETAPLPVSSVYFQKDCGMKLCFKDFWYTFIDFFSSASLAISGTKNEVLVGAELNGDGQQWLLVLFPFLFPLLGGDKRPRAKARPTIVSHPQPNTEIVSRIITRPKGQEGP